MTPEDIARSVKDWSRIWERAPHWRGHACQQFATDMWRYAELLHELQPPWVLELGTADGGPALFLADVLALTGKGRVMSVDNDPRQVTTTHPWLTLLKGNTVDPVTAEEILRFTAGERGLILLDDDHSSAHVLAELELYAGLADYLIVQDTLMEFLPQYSDGPHVALAKWLPGHPEFAIDPDPVPSNHPGGWLRRVSG